MVHGAWLSHTYGGALLADLVIYLLHVQFYDEPFRQNATSAQRSQRRVRLVHPVVN